MANFVKMILTTGIVSARSLLITAGSGTAKGSPGILIFASDNAVSNAAGELATLISFTLPGGTLANDGDMLVIEASTTQANDTDLKLSAITFGGTVVSSRSGVADQNLPRTLRCTIMRTGATTQISDGFCMANGAAVTISHAAPAETLSGNITIALKGQNQTDTTTPSVTSRHLAVWYFPIGQAANFS